MIYVLNKEGKPLMPTSRHGKVRRLLRDKVAVIVNYNPFTIQLTTETRNEVDEVSLGVDTGHSSYDLDELFKHCEYKDVYGNWIPFGVEE